MSGHEETADQGRLALNALQVTAPDLPAEHHHLYRCGECGLLVDRRNLGDVLHHEQNGHEPSGALVGLQFLEPMLATLVPHAPEGDEWLHEIKYDGYRTQIIIDGGELRAFTRNGHDWTERYRPVLRAAGALACDSAIIDGEMIVQDAQGRADFESFKKALRWQPERLVFMAFDIMHLNGRDLRQDNLLDRRGRLQELVGCYDPASRVQFSEHVVGGGAAMFEAADALGLEGIVSKKRNSRYRSGRSRSWLKVKCFAEAEFLVLGVQPGNRGPATALLGRRAAGRIDYAGGAAVTLPNKERELFWQGVDALTSPSPIVPVPRAEPSTWVRPGMSVRVRYLKGSDKLRHATLCGVTFTPADA